MKHPFLFVALLLMSTNLWAIEYTKGYALETKTGAHIGFVLGSPGFKPESGDCVFVLLPTDADAVNTPLGIEISELKAEGEHHWTKKNGSIIVQKGNRVRLTISAAGDVLNAENSIIGRVVPVPESE